MLILLILPVIFICLADGVILIKKKQWRELSTMGLLIGIAVFFIIAESLDIPTPIDGLHQLLGPVGKAIFK